MRVFFFSSFFFFAIPQIYEYNISAKISMPIKDISSKIPKILQKTTLLHGRDYRKNIFFLLTKSAKKVCQF
jgi:hypothetical protein